MERRVKYYKPTHVAGQKIGEICVRETTGTLLKICDDGRYLIENDETKTVDTVGGKSLFGNVFGGIDILSRVHFID